MAETQEYASHPEFDMTVEAGGYRWWYLDGISDDRQRAITIIVFVGSVFSPYYRRARVRGEATAHNYCAVNVALYGRSGKRWAMTERGSGSLLRDHQRIQVGPSSMHWTGDEIRLDLNEISVPWPSRIQGHIRLVPTITNTRAFRLDQTGRHFWHPLFPRAQIEVRLKKPDLKWQGSAYFDTNHGSAALEEDFVSWDWSRMHLPGGESRLQYDRRLISGDRHCLTAQFDRSGELRLLPAGDEITLPKTRIWKIPRSTRAGLDERANMTVETLEDTPFYARSLVNMNHQGEAVEAIHESLSMTRFKQDWVHLLLPFRMPRLA